MSGGVLKSFPSNWSVNVSLSEVLKIFTAR